MKLNNNLFFLIDIIFFFFFFIMENKPWIKYVKSLKEASNSEIEVSWNKHRQLIMVDDRKKKQILLNEITKNNCDVYFLLIYILIRILLI